MGTALFVPMNTNHVLILKDILKPLQSKYQVLCHDKLCHGTQYFTEKILSKFQINFVHFDESCSLPYQAGFLEQLKAYFKMKQIIQKKINSLSPDVVILFIDNDPVAQHVIKISRKKRIKTILIQDGLIRPDEYTKMPLNFSRFIYSMFKLFGISMKYIIYGTGGCDKILVNGQISYEILQKRGVSPQKMTIVGQPKYDSFLKNIQFNNLLLDEKITYLFAATKDLIRDDRNIKFLKILVRSCKELGVKLIVKMHPRVPDGPETVFAVLKNEDLSNLEIIKEGDDTITILKKCYGIITLYSTVVLEALMMDKEGIVIHYLSGQQNLRHYDKFNAIYPINEANETIKVIKKSLKQKKEYRNKKKLLESELFKLDGNASLRVANIIDSYVLK